MTESIRKRIQFLSDNKNNLIIDADTHISDTENMHPELKKQMLLQPNYYHGKPINASDLLKEMKMAGVDMCLIWQNPAATFYPGDRMDNYKALLAANTYIFDASEQYPTKFIPAGWTDPRSLGIDMALKLIDICIKDFGFPIMKINPAQNQFPIDSKEVFQMVEHIIELGAIPAFHFGADTIFTPPEGLEKLAKKFAHSPIIAIHMGGGGAGYVEAEEHYTKAREIGLENPNIKYVLSAKRDTHIESDLISYQSAGEPFSSNIFCASDAPYGRQTWNFGGYMKMFESLKNGANHTDSRLNKNPQLFNDTSISKYLGGNFADLVLKAYFSRK